MEPALSGWRHCRIQQLYIQKKSMRGDRICNKQISYDPFSWFSRDEDWLWRNVNWNISASRRHHRGWAQMKLKDENYVAVWKWSPMKMVHTSRINLWCQTQQYKVYGSIPRRNASGTSSRGAVVAMVSLSQPILFLMLSCFLLGKEVCVSGKSHSEYTRDSWKPCQGQLANFVTGEPPENWTGGTTAFYVSKLGPGKFRSIT